MTDRDRKNDRHDSLDRRSLLRRAGMLGMGVIGASVVGCKGRPDQDFVDLSTEPSLVQAGGTISGRVNGVLSGNAAPNVRIRLQGLGSVTTDQDGNYSLRVEERGDYGVEINGPDFVARASRLRVSGSATVNIGLLERDAGLPLDFLDEYGRGAGPGAKEGVASRTPGHTNRWTGAPRVIIYRQLEDDDKDVIPDARLTAMQASVLSLFGPLTGNALGFGGVQVRNAPPPRSVERVDAGTIAIVQRTDNLLEARTLGATVDRYALVKARISCGVESTIELFHRMFAHALGGQVVSPGFDSILNAGGRAAPSNRDLAAATFIHSRVPGNRAPDTDPAGVLLNA